ncbi:MAG: diguanylate cyclase [Deltaproteobacteria bacterium]|nr:diguanylate cyclase [Deltaproteobacteria bacterium]
MPIQGKLQMPPPRGYNILLAEDNDFNQQLTRAALAIPHAHSTIADHVTVSIGCATYIPPPDDNWGMLVNATDKMLYRAKNEGRNRISIEELLKESSAPASSAFHLVVLPS